MLVMCGSLFFKSAWRKVGEQISLSLGERNAWWYSFFLTHVFSVEQETSEILYDGQQVVVPESFPPPDANVHNILMMNNPSTAHVCMNSLRVALKMGRMEMIPSFFFDLESPSVDAYKKRQKAVLQNAISRVSTIIPTREHQVQKAMVKANQVRVSFAATHDVPEVKEDLYHDDSSDEESKEDFVPSKKTRKRKKKKKQQQSSVFDLFACCSN